MPRTYRYRQHFHITIPLYSDPQHPHRVFGDDTEMPDFIQSMLADNDVGELRLDCLREGIDDPGDFDTPPHQSLDNVVESVMIRVSGEKKSLSIEQEHELRRR